MMNKAALTLDNNGRIIMSGELTFDNVKELWQQGQALLAKMDVSVFDLSQVVRSDSAGLALLIAWLREATLLGKSIQFLSFPRQMQAIAKVSGLETILPIK